MLVVGKLARANERTAASSMDLGSLAALREEAKKRRLEKTRAAATAAGTGGHREDREEKEAKEPEHKKARTDELLKELQEQKDKNAAAAAKHSDDAAPAEGTIENKTEEESTEVQEKDVETMKELRRLGQPIVLFGETPQQRQERLAKATTTQTEANEGKESAKPETETAAAVAAEVKPKKSAVDKTSKEEVVRKYLKGLLKEWEAEFEAKSSKEFLESHRGKVAAVTLKQCRESVGHLFELLRQRTVAKDVVDHLDKIVAFMKQREYSKATDEYLKLAIGNAPWPMGVTMVGIHERAGREKIYSDKVARLFQTTTTNNNKSHKVHDV